MILQIFNKIPGHYEIIESIIVKYREFFDDIDKEKVEIYLDLKESDANASFQLYISEKYPSIQYRKQDGTPFDYYIHCTIYNSHFPKLQKKKSNQKYIAHNITKRLQENPNVFFLTPLAGTKNLISCDILPFMDQKRKTDIPIYIVQGGLKNSRRNFTLLRKILSETNCNQPFIIKMIGRGELPDELSEYKERIVVKSDLDFIDYHKEFLDGYCILPLTSIHSHPQYYSTKFTSTINYAKAYKLKCLLDEDLQKIYQLENAQVYKDESDIKEAFLQTLSDFYET